MKYKLSIIIPVYNTQDYVDKCIMSCLNQDLESNKFEIIIINDGSTDNSGKIIQKYAEKHSNIKSITKQNEGVSSARNKGISVAKGEYLLFVDSDDSIEQNSLNAIISETEKRKNQLMILISLIYRNNKPKVMYNFPQELTNKTYTGIKLFQKGYLRGSVCGVLFKKQFILDNKLKFSEKIRNGEDSLFMSMSFLYATSISHLNIDFYKVTVREGSASRVWHFDKVKEMLNGLNVINGFIGKNALTDEQLAILNIKAYGIISNTLYYFFSIHSLSGYSELKNSIKKSHLYPIKPFGAKQFRNKIYLLNFSFDLFCVPFLFRKFYSDAKRLVLR
ncbi:MAG: glycosyltransferase [Mariniphaga sp.]|nr:glycosyltransferase [Mariniphaga sp.]